MSQFETTGLGPYRRASGVIPTSPGRQVSPNAPGLAPLPVVQSEGEVLARQLQQALYGVGDVAAGIGATANRMTNDIEEQIRQRAYDAAAAERARKAADIAEAGLGQQIGQESAPQILSDLEAGKLAPAPGETQDQFYQRVTSNLGEGLGPSGLTGLDEYLRPRFNQAMVTAANRAAELSKTTTRNLTIARSENVTDPAAAAELAQTLIDTGMDPEAATASVISGAIRGAGIRGDEATLNSLKSSADTTLFKTDIAVAEAAIAQKKAAELDTKAAGDLKHAEDLVALGVPEQTVRKFVDSSNWLSPTQKSEFYDRIAKADAGRRKQAQSFFANQLQVDILNSRRPLDQIEADVRARVALSPDDPRFLDADAANTMVNAIQAKQKFDAEDAISGAWLKGIREGKTGTVLPPGMDNSLLANMADEGTVSGVRDGTSFKYVGLNNVTASMRTFAVAGQVPKQVTEGIQSKLASPNPAEQADGWNQYAAIYAASPVLTQNLPIGDDQKYRARFIESRIDILGLADKMIDDASLAREMAPVLSQAALLRPSDIGKMNEAEKLYAIYGEDYGKKTPKDKLDRGTGDIKSIYEDNFEGDIGVSLDSVPDYIASDYMRAVPQEFEYSSAFIKDKEAAIKQAKANAFKRVVAHNPMVTWGGNVKFLPPDSKQYDSEAVKAQLTNDVGDDYAETLWEKYTPEMIVHNGQPAFIFHDNLDYQNLAPAPDADHPLVLTFDAPAKVEFDLMASARKPRRRPEDVLFRPYTVVK